MELKDGGFIYRDGHGRCRTDYMEMDANCYLNRCLSGKNEVVIIVLLFPIKCENKRSACIRIVLPNKNNRVLECTISTTVSEKFHNFPFRK